jgi:hypothetical protein
VEQKIQMLIQFVVRTIGPILLRGGLGGGGGGGAATTGTASRDDDFDDFDDDDDKTNDPNKGIVSISLPTFAPDNDDDSSNSSPASALSDSAAAASSRINLLESFNDNVSQSSEAPSIR